MGQKPAKAGQEAKPAEEPKKVEPKKEEPPPVAAVKKEEPVTPKPVAVPEAAQSPLRVDMTAVPDADKRADRRGDGVKFNGAVDVSDFKAEPLPENVDPTINPMPVGAVQGSLGSLMAATLGVKHEGKTTGLVKKQKQPELEEDRLYHINQGANKDLAKAFGEMVVASRLKKSTPGQFVPPSAIAKEEAQKREEGIDRTGIAEKIAAERAKKLKAEEEEREKKKAAEAERKKAEMAEMKKKQEARAAASASSGGASATTPAAAAGKTDDATRSASPSNAQRSASPSNADKIAAHAAEVKAKKAEEEKKKKEEEDKKKKEEEDKKRKDAEEAKKKKEEAKKAAEKAEKDKVEHDAAQRKKELDEAQHKKEEAVAAAHKKEAEAAEAKKKEHEQQEAIKAAEAEAARVAQLNESLKVQVESAISNFEEGKGLGVIIAGPPAAGKGTQCEFIRDKYGLCHISTGDLLREHVKNGTDVGKRAKDFMDNGRLVPDDLIIELVHSKMQEPGVKEKGWLLDGFPRTKAQADALAKAGIVADTFVLIHVGDDVLVERVVGRRLDPKTGKIYHMKFDPPKDEETAARLTQRSDDTEEKIAVRIKQYHDNIAAIIDNYQDVLHNVEGNKHPTKVFNQIKNGLNKGLDKKGLPVPEIDVQEPPSPKPTVVVTSPTGASSPPKVVTIQTPTPTSKHDPEDFRMSKAEVTRALRRYTQQATSGADVLSQTMELFWEQADPDGSGHVSAADIFEWVKRGIRIPVLRNKTPEEVEIMLEQDMHGGEITKSDFFKSLREWASGKRRPEEGGEGSSSTPRDSTSPGEGDGGGEGGDGGEPTLDAVDEEKQAAPAETTDTEAGAAEEEPAAVEAGDEDAPPPSAEEGVPVEEGDAPPPAGEGEDAPRESNAGEDAAPPGDEEAPGE